MNRIIDITYQEKLSHLGSCLTTYPILDAIYKLKKPDDHVVLSNGHSGLALYVKLEEEYGIDPIKLLHDYGIHPVRDIERHIEVSSGSLGSAVLIACGIALGDPDNAVHCVISDGECAEGSVWEALYFANRIPNLSINVNINGYGAYDPINVAGLIKRLRSFLPTINIWRTSAECLIPGLLAHYYVTMDKDCETFKENAQRIRCTLISNDDHE